MNCNFHNGQQYVFICTTNHQCQRRFCPQCFSQHLKEYSNLLTFSTIEDFFRQSMECINKLDDQQELFKKNFQNVQIEFNELFERIRKNFEILYTDLNDLNKDYKALKIKLSQPTLEELTNSEINKIVNALNTNIITAINLQKAKVREILTKTNEKLELSLQKILQNLNNFICRKKVTLNEYQGYNLEYIEPKIFNFSHGECFYQVKGIDCMSSCAGRIKFSQKIGEWKIINNSKGKNYGWSLKNYDFANEKQLPINIQNNVLLPGTINFLEQPNYYNENKMLNYEKEKFWYEEEKKKQVIKIYSQNKQIGQWNSNIYNLFFSKMVLSDSWGGEFDDKGQKIGMWIENVKHLQRRGFYNNGKKVGSWKTYYDFSCVEEGNYNEQGEKQGRWKEIVIDSQNQVQEFNQNRKSNIYLLGYYTVGQKVGEWKICDDEKLIGGGVYNDNGLKNGKWKEIDFQYYDNLRQVYFEGAYREGIRVGEWKIYYEGNLIGEGSYNSQGVKNGKWKDIAIQYYDQYSQISFQGKYREGIKVGKWKILFNNNPIGGGVYDDKGVKNGKWRDIDEQYFKEKQEVCFEGVYKQGIKTGEWRFFYIDDIIGWGLYDDQGKKVGKWKDIDIQQYGLNRELCFEGDYRAGVRVKEWKIFYKENLIGGGFYNEEGEKNGQWIDIDIQCYSKTSQISFKGHYKQGIKVGEWKIFNADILIGGGSYNEGFQEGMWSDINIQYYKEGRELIFEGEYTKGIQMGKWKIFNKKKLVGGGFYDEQGIKHGKWKDIDVESITEQEIVSFEGAYMQGIRVGQWKICIDHQLMGGGFYSEEGEKNGKWRDIGRWRSVILEGEYKQGIKIGEWKIFYFEKLIGGGYYNDEGAKNGLWKDILHSTETYQDSLPELNFYQRLPFVIFEGAYRQGIKNGEWKIFLFHILVGGGFYDNEGKKNGKWREIDKSGLNIFEGIYCLGIKVGDWKNITTSSTQGGGFYNDDGLKNGNWVEIEQQDSNSIFIFEGIYRKGIKVGKWKILYKDNQIGGGFYNEQGVKNGKWKEIDIQNYNENSELIFEGEYQQGCKVGEWKIFYHDYQIGGGFYNDEGIKNGKWKEIDISCYRQERDVCFEGFYKQGIKVGEWKYLSHEFLIGGGFYNDQGFKQGKWKEIDTLKFVEGQTVCFEGFYKQGNKIGIFREVGL